jgi:hypothetical protein
MPDLHPRRITEFVKPSRVEPGLEGAPGEGPWFTGPGVKDLVHTAAGR